MNLQNFTYNRPANPYPLTFQTRQSGTLQLLQMLIPLLLGNTRSSDRFDNSLNIFADSKPLDMSFDTTTSGGIPVPEPGGPVLGGDQAALAKGGRQHPNLVVTDPNNYRDDVKAALKKNGLDPEKYVNIVLAMIWQESKGDPKAVGNDGQGSMGLMQVIKANQGSEDHFKPAVSINAGVVHFAKELKAQGNDLSMALAAYNQGPGGKNTEPAKKYSTQIQNKAKFFEQGKTPAGQTDPTSPGFHEPPLGGKSGDPNPEGLVSVDGEEAAEEEEEIVTPGGKEEIEGANEEPIDEDPPVNNEKPPATTEGSTGSDYVDMMIKALRANGADEDHIAAYMHQYELLGLIKPGTKAGAGTPSDKKGPIPDTKDTPDKKDPPPAGGSGGTYTVQTGDTIISVAKKLGVTPGALMTANPQIKDPDKIKAGDTWKIPDGKDKATVPEGFDTKAQTVPLTDEETKARADKWTKQLQKDLGLTHAQAVGIVANLCHESWGLNPGIMQGGKIMPAGPDGNTPSIVNQTGFGICQWGEDRRDGLLASAKLQGLPVTSEAAQYGYIMEELKTMFGAHLDLVKGVKGEGAKAAQEVTKLFAGGGASLPLPNGVRGYLAPSQPDVEKRLAWLDEKGEITVPKTRPRAMQ